MPEDLHLFDGVLIIITTRPGKFWFGFALAAALVGPVRRVSALVTAVGHTNCTGQEGYDSLVTSVRDRQMFLRDRFTTLRDEIVATHRERDVVDLAEALQQGKPLSPPSDAEFDLLLPSERAAALPAYFLALRTELVVIEGDGLQARKAGRLAEWLHGPMPKVAAEAAAASLSAFLLSHGWEALRDYTSGSIGLEDVKMRAMSSPVMVTLQSQFLIDGQPVIPKGINVQDYTALVSKIGAKYVRLRFKWSDVEPVQGTFDWSSLDNVVAAYSADHVNMLLDNHPIGVQNIPAWAFPNPQENAFGLLAALADHYRSEPYVWGYEVWNEPHWGTADAAGTISVLQWMAKAQAIIRAHDPTRATVMMIRDSWNLGLQNADLRRWLPNLQHLVLDVHDSYATGSNAGYSSDGEGHAADLCKTTWPCAVPYSGIYQHQLDHLKWVLRWKAELNRPIIVGEWDWMTMQPGWDKYQRQMLSIFDELNLPWFRWQGGTQSLMDKGVLNPMGQQIADALA